MNLQIRTELWNEFYDKGGYKGGKCAIALGHMSSAVSDELLRESLEAGIWPARLLYDQALADAYPDFTNSAHLQHLYGEAANG